MLHLPLLGESNHIFMYLQRTARKRCFKRLFYSSFTKSFHEIVTSTVADWGELLHEKDPVIMLSIGRVSEGGSFSRTRIKIAASINETVISTAFSFTFCAVIASFTFLRNFHLFVHNC